MTGRLKKMTTQRVAMITMYLSQRTSQPTQKSVIGQSEKRVLSQGELSVQRQLAMMENSQRAREQRKVRKALLLWMPTQLLSHGQW